MRVIFILSTFWTSLRISRLLRRSGGTVTTVWGVDPVYPEDRRLSSVQIMEIEGVTIGMVHSFPLPGESPSVSLEKNMNRLFGKQVNVIVFGDTHDTISGIMMVYYW